MQNTQQVKERILNGALDRVLLDLYYDESILEEQKKRFVKAIENFQSMKNPLKYYDNNLCGTKTLLDALVAHGIKFVSLRYFNACGAHVSGKIGEEHNPETHLIPLILQVPNGQREAISVFGTDYPTKDGTCIRDYIHVTDLADAHILAVKYLMSGNESNIFNLGNGAGFTVKEVIEMAEKVTGQPIKIIETDRRAGDPAVLIASSKKAKAILGWEPKHNSLKEIIQTAWVWHKNHPNGYKNV